MKTSIKMEEIILKSTIFGERIKTLRISLGKSQKEFAEFIGIPQPSMSAYENGKNNPTIEVLVNIADKCNVSIDWLCGRQAEVSLSDLSDIASFLYKLMETNEIGCEIDVHDRMENGLDIEKEGKRMTAIVGGRGLLFMGMTENSSIMENYVRLLVKLMRILAI